MKKILFMFLIAVLVLTGCTKPSNEKTDAEKVAEAKEALTISGDLTNVTNDLVLPTSGENDTVITWESSNTDVITNDGVVTPSVDGDATVILTATITLNEESDTKEFTVVVKQSTGPMCPGIEDPSDHEVANSGFETGDLCGWTITGDAFKDEYVLDLETFWTGDSYNKDGSYLFTSNDHEGETGTLTSTTFTLGGSGWISFKLGAAKHTDQLYMVIKNTNGTEDMSDDTEVVRYGNTEFDDNLFTANLVQYKADLSDYLNEELYIQIVDNATSDWAWISMDSFITYYANESDLPLDAVLASDVTPSDIDCSSVVAPSAYELINGGFDTGNICGWTASGEAFTHSDLSDDPISWGDATYAPEGDYFYSSWKNNNESKTGTLKSSTFELGGTGYITFRLGAAKPKTNLEEAIYILVVKEDGTEVARFMNEEFNDGPQLFTYKADLSAYIGENLYVQVVDNASGDWGVMFMDSFNTYYTDNANLPADAIEAINQIAPDTTKPVISGTHDFELAVGATEPNWLDGVTATDDVDGDVTVTVDATGVNLNEVGSYTVTYTAVDSSDNEETVTVNIVVTTADVTDPTISGHENVIYVLINSTEPNWLDGVTADDNTDGDLTSSITLDKGQFALDTLGTYTITYTVADQAENSTSVTTTVHVVDTLPTIENGGFETGDFTGWTPTGDAFTENGINGTGGFNSDGTYHFNTWTQGDNGGSGEEATGTLTSSMFRLSGSGFITFKIGGAKNTELIYIQVLLEDGTEIARFGNDLFVNQDMILYKADLSNFIGQKMYIKVVDNATSDWAFTMLDSFVTYYETEANLPSDANLAVNYINEPTIVNGDFETSDLTGWTSTGDFFDPVGVSNNGENNSTGYYFYPWYTDGSEGRTGTLTSSTFRLMGSGYITFQIGGAKHPDVTYVSVYTTDGTEVARYGNIAFDNSGNLKLYVANLNDYLNQDLYIVITDNATEDWGQIVLDEFITYYPQVADLPQDAISIPNMLAATSTPASSYEIANPSFETGDLTGWTATGDAFIDDFVFDTNTNWWGVVGKDDYCYLVNNDNEPGTGTLTSTTFTLNNTGFITFRMGGADNENEIYISIYKEDGTEVARYGNTEFDNNGFLNLYKADLTNYIGENLYIQIVDNDVADWAWISVDDFNTNYQSEADISADAVLATDLLTTN